MSPGLQEECSATGQQETDPKRPELADYIDKNRNDLEKLAEEEYRVSRLIQALLDRRDRGEI